MSKILVKINDKRINENNDAAVNSRYDKQLYLLYKEKLKQYQNGELPDLDQSVIDFIQMYEENYKLS